MNHVPDELNAALSNAQTLIAHRMAHRDTVRKTAHPLMRRLERAEESVFAALEHHYALLTVRNKLEAAEGDELTALLEAARDPDSISLPPYDL